MRVFLLECRCMHFVPDVGSMNQTNRSHCGLLSSCFFPARCHAVPCCSMHTTWKNLIQDAEDGKAPGTGAEEKAPGPEAEEKVPEGEKFKKESRPRRWPLKKTRSVHAKREVCVGHNSITTGSRRARRSIFIRTTWRNAQSKSCHNWAGLTLAGTSIV